jgi:iron-sulfur cluster repair protein YtfE (RIC family)
MTIVESVARLPPRRGLQLLMPDHHRRLDQMCREVLVAAYADEPRALIMRWCALELELVDHMAAEEQVILPGYAAYAPADAQKIRDDHVRIRALVAPIGVEVELHEVRIARLGTLIEALEAHTLHEDTRMYPWVANNLSSVARQLLHSRITGWLVTPR